MSYLVECQRDGVGTVSSQDVADARQLSKPLAAKILTTLSKVGIVKGSTGPGGGYQLAKAPEEISLLEVVMQFELQNNIMMCPFGDGWCGNYDPCPLHDRIAELQEEQMRFLQENDFGGFMEPGYSSKRPGGE